MPSSSLPRLFAVIPAAGHSRRMGRPKLLLPLGSNTVIGRMLAALSEPVIAATIVVVRRDDEPLRAAIADSGAIPLQPAVAPEEMRQSVEHALRYIEEEFHPRPEEGWLLAPADHPLLEPAVIERLASEWRAAQGNIVVPAYRGRRGHPTLFPFSLAAEVFRLPADQGLNRLVQMHAALVREVELDSPSVLADLDTPEDYERLRRGIED
jgi:molybdenum cofactor cytidylyltransferase